MKKIATVALATVMLFSCGCSVLQGGDKGKTDAFSTVLTEQDTTTLSVGETVSYPINQDISGKEYIRLTLESEVNLHGVYVYANADNSAQVVEEEFFIESATGEIEFKQFFDAFRKNGIGQFDKILKEIKLTNVDNSAGVITFQEAAVSNRAFPKEAMMLFLQKDELKIGADLATGGTLSYLSRISYGDSTIDEVVDGNDDVTIGVNAKEGCKEFISSEVNLVNIYDAGRQIQQSYYANVGGEIGVDDPNSNLDEVYLWQEKADNYGENGYDRAWCTTGSKTGWWWPYNPVQAGDCADNPGQIIDYELRDNEIYVKARAMDWAKGADSRKLAGTVEGGVTTKSYMENWYTIKNNLLYVSNRFIDWNGFTGMESVLVHTNELPAFFTVHPLKNLVMYDGSLPWKNGALSEYKNISDKHTSWPSEDWIAWVNDSNFGIGVYVPNINYVSSSRSLATSKKVAELNKGAFNCAMIEKGLLNNKPYPTSTYTSCYVFNLSYSAPVVSWTMREYTPMEYQYVVSVDYVDIMRAQFKELNDSGLIKNEKFDEWRS